MQNHVQLDLYNDQRGHIVLVLLPQAQPYFSENANAGADAAYGVQQVQDRVAAAAAAADSAAAGAQAAVAARGSKGPLVPPAGMSPEAAAAAAASYAGLIPAGPQAADMGAVASEAAAPFHKGVAAERQAAAVALGPEGFAALLDKVWGCGETWFQRISLYLAYPISRGAAGLHVARACKQQGCVLVRCVRPCSSTDLVFETCWPSPRWAGDVHHSMLSPLFLCVCRFRRPMRSCQQPTLFTAASSSLLLMQRH